MACLCWWISCPLWNYCLVCELAWWGDPTRGMATVTTFPCHFDAWMLARKAALPTLRRNSFRSSWTKNCALGTQPQYHHPLQLRIQYVLQVISKNSAADATKSEDLLAFCKQGEASLKKMIQYMHDNFNKTTKIPVSDKLSLESLRLGRD